ncbi:MAG: DUF5652 family protein [Candidatus Bathyarchaeia archaeon]
MFQTFGVTEFFIIIPLAGWSFFWMALGLWFSARNSDKGWFIFFLLVHLVGIPEIIYLRMRRCWPFKPKR